MSEERVSESKTQKKKKRRRKEYFANAPEQGNAGITLYDGRGRKVSREEWDRRLGIEKRKD